MKFLIKTGIAVVLLCSCLLLFLSSCSRKKNESILIGAAASLTDSMKEISTAFMKEKNGADVQLSFAATGKLRAQIEKGAPIHVFASASESFGGKKDVSDILDTASIKIMCYNCLVLAVNKNFQDAGEKIDPAGFIMSEKIKKLAIGTPEYVPAGNYAKMKMTEMGIWEKASGKMIFANNVRQALAWLESGEVDAAFIYRTDAYISSKVKIVSEFPIVNGKKIIYPVALTKLGKDNPLAASFEDFVLSGKSKAILEKHGFMTTPITEKKP